MKILIATDGSEFSKTAVIESCKFIVPENAEIKIVSAFEDSVPIAAEPFAMSAEYYQNLEEAVTEQAAEFIRQAEADLRGQFPGTDLNITTQVLRGVPDQQIIETAKDWKADLIVVGSHGRGFWGRLLGSVSTGVVHHAPCSVLVVRKPA